MNRINMSLIIEFRVKAFIAFSIDGEKNLSNFIIDIKDNKSIFIYKFWIKDKIYCCWKVILVQIKEKNIFRWILSSSYI